MKLSPRTIGYGLIAILVTALIIFVIYELRGISRGPEITVTSHEQFSSSASSFLTISGEIRNVSKLIINGNNVIPYTNSTFSYPIILSAGINSIILDGYSKFQKHTRIQLDIFGNFDEWKPELLSDIIEPSS
ncbi:hypothetical protein A2997_00585 [Candidatus Nomurabacteria bacterium RIFCSPLOWO2_01_FULL_36_10b]|uniref:IPT/TIG domain-containing protein n=1 Tax=Candidatus Nomurabacteria bacterium RIFCSPLOWO2_01_FULL_36_10b TaxID=1801766 RepID=A0A1F6WQ88_9BACT|nr:MAG: hypothetical protein A2997_00585 [Candidatus Nomurabacteria bacterium RIFCSPLOWO2_01_FULL_36_10b]